MPASTSGRARGDRRVRGHPRGAQGAQDVEVPRAAQQRIPEPRLPRRHHQPGLHGSRVQRRVLLDHQRRRRGDDRGGHAGSRHLEVLDDSRLLRIGRHAAVGQEHVHAGSRRARGNDPVARRDEVGLGDQVERRGTARGVRSRSCRPGSAPCVTSFVAPTVITFRELQGLVIVTCPLRPRLPAEQTTTIPASQSASTASTRGSSAAGSNTGCPRETFTTRIPYSVLWSRTHWSPAEHVRGQPAPEVVEDAHRDQARLGGNPGHAAVGLAAVADHDARDVRAVAVGVDAVLGRSGLRIGMADDVDHRGQRSGCRGAGPRRNRRPRWSRRRP